MRNRVFIAASVHLLGIIREIAAKCDTRHRIMGTLGVLPRILGESPPILDVGHIDLRSGKRR